MRTEQEIRDKIEEYIEHMARKDTDWNTTLLAASAVHALKWALEE